MKIVFIITIVVFSGWPWMVLQVGSTPLSECRPRACPTQARQEAAKAGGGKDLRPSRRTASIQHSHTRSRTHARAVALVAEAAAGAARKNLKKSNLSQKRRKNELQEVHHVSWTGQGDGVHPLLLVIRAQVPAIYHLVAAYELEHQPERSACLTSSSAKVSERANERTPWRSSSCTFGLALMHAISLDGSSGGTRTWGLRRGHRGRDLPRARLSFRWGGGQGTGPWSSGSPFSAPPVGLRGDGAWTRRRRKAAGTSGERDQEDEATAWLALLPCTARGGEGSPPAPALLPPAPLKPLRVAQTEIEFILLQVRSRSRNRSLQIFDVVVLSFFLSFVCPSLFFYFHKQNITFGLFYL